MIPWINLKRQYDSIKEEMLQGISEVLDSGQYILGNCVKKLESELAGFNSVKHCVGLNSGTDALHLALRAIGVKQGDEVITVPNVSAPTACAITAANATPVFVDVEPGTHNMDFQKLESAITSKTRAILPVHLYGQCCNMDKILKIARNHGLNVIEDAAQAIGAVHKGTACGFAGTLGDIGCFSFYPTKNLGAYGDAGAVITDDEELARKVRMLGNYGESSKYENKMPGFNSRMDEIQAKIIYIKLRHLDKWIKRRQEIAGIYIKELKSENMALPKPVKYSTHTYHLFTAEVENRDSFRKKLESKGIGTGIHYPKPLHLQEAFQYLGYKKGYFPVSEKSMEKTVSLPMFPELTNEEVSEIIESVKTSLD